MRVIFINHFNLDSDLDSDLDLDLDLDPIGGSCASQLIRDITYDFVCVFSWSVKFE